MSEIKAPALSIGYAMMGFFNAANEVGLSLHELSCGDGEIGLMQDLVDRIDYVERVWQERFQDKDTWAGVWEYEIVEPYGGTLAEYLKINSAMPDEAWCRATIASLIENSGACMEF